MPGLFFTCLCRVELAGLHLPGADVKKPSVGPAQQEGARAGDRAGRQFSTRSTAPGFSTLLPLRPFSDSRALTGMP